MSQNTPWRGKFAALNCFGFGGANVHVLLKAPEEVTPTISTNSMLKPVNSSANLLMSGAPPRLMLVSGRTEEHVEKVLSEFQANRHSHFASLIDNINEYESSTVSYPYRGYTIVGGISEGERQNLNVSLYFSLLLLPFVVFCYYHFERKCDIFKSKSSSDICSFSLMRGLLF